MREVFDYRRLKELLKERGWSQAKLARALNVNPRVVSRYVHGERKPGVLTLLKMADVLKVPVEELVRINRYKED